MEEVAYHGVEFFNKVVHGFDELAKSENRFKTIDASSSIEEIHAEIMSYITLKLVR